MRTVAAMRPDVYVALTDEVYAHASKKHADNCVLRTTDWLATCLELHSQLKLGPEIGVIASIAGSSDVSKRARCLEAVLARDADLAGTLQTVLAQTAAVLEHHACCRYVSFIDSFMYSLGP